MKQYRQKAGESFGAFQWQGEACPEELKGYESVVEAHGDVLVIKTCTGDTVVRKGDWVLIYNREDDPTSLGWQHKDYFENYYEEMP